MKIADWTTKGLICGHCGKVMGAANDKAQEHGQKMIRVLVIMMP